MKEDVAKKIPPKEETVVEVELTMMQKQYYRAVLEKNRDFLSKVGTVAMACVQAGCMGQGGVLLLLRMIVMIRVQSLNYLPYDIIIEAHLCTVPCVLQGGRSADVPKLLNVVMQLRKVCNHPYLLTGVEDSETAGKTSQKGWCSVLCCRGSRSRA